MLRCLAAVYLLSVKVQLRLSPVASEQWADCEGKKKSQLESNKGVSVENNALLLGGGSWGGQEQTEDKTYERTHNKCCQANEILF